MGTEMAAARSQFVSGTHAISAALFGCLRNGDVLISATGAPYDTLRSVIGGPMERFVQDDKDAFFIEDDAVDLGTLHDWGIEYRQVSLDSEGRVDAEALKRTIVSCDGRARMVLVQRSCGYDIRPTISLEDVARTVRTVESCSDRCVVLVDNCYGEFTDEEEPGHVGAHLIAGSFIKNIGGTIAPGGGYVAGRRDLVERACARLSAPGIGAEAGSVPAEYARLMLQGIWMAPGVVGEAAKGALLVAEVMRSLGYRVRHREGDVVASVILGSPERMLRFAEAVQRSCPVGSYILPVPGATPGYSCDVVFADGSFVDGSTSELSADGPIRPPYAIYCQGGTHWTQWAWALERVVEQLHP